MSTREELLEQSIMRDASRDLYDALYAMMYGHQDDEIRKRAWGALAKAEGRHTAKWAPAGNGETG